MFRSLFIISQEALSMGLQFDSIHEILEVWPSHNGKSTTASLC